MWNGTRRYGLGQPRVTALGLEVLVQREVLAHVLPLQYNAHDVQRRTCCFEVCTTEYRTLTLARHRSQAQHKNGAERRLAV